MRLIDQGGDISGFAGALEVPQCSQKGTCWCIAPEMPRSLKTSCVALPLSPVSRDNLHSRAQGAFIPGL